MCYGILLVAEEVAGESSIPWLTCVCERDGECVTLTGELAQTPGSDWQTVRSEHENFSYIRKSMSWSLNCRITWIWSVCVCLVYSYIVYVSVDVEWMGSLCYRLFSQFQLLREREREENMCNRLTFLVPKLLLSLRLLFSFFLLLYLDSLSFSVYMSSE